MTAPAGGHTRRVTFRGEARHAATTQRIALCAGIYPPLDPPSADQPPSLHAPTLTDDAKCCKPTMGAMRRVTSAKRGQWAESKRQWLDVRPISWRVQMGQRDSSAPQDTVHIAAAQDTSHRPRSSSSGVRTKAGEPSADELTGTQVGEAPPHRHKQHLKAITSPGIYGMNRGIEPWLMNMDLK